MLPALLARWSREPGGRGPDDWSASLQVNYPLKRFLLLCRWQVGRSFTWSDSVSRQHQEEGKEDDLEGLWGVQGLEVDAKYCMFLKGPTQGLFQVFVFSGPDQIKSRMSATLKIIQNLFNPLFTANTRNSRQKVGPKWGGNSCLGVEAVWDIELLWFLETDHVML